MQSFQKEGWPVYAISEPQGGTKAEIIPDMGAAISSLRINGHELLFLQPWFWDKSSDRTRGGLPFLFPACGRLERNGQAGLWYWKHHLYRMQPHGFAMRMPWAVTRFNQADSLALELHDTPETREQYPFAFSVELVFRVEPGAFFIEQTYTNTGTDEMPFSAGFHPYFLTPPPGQGKEKTLIRFQSHQRLLYNTSLTDLQGVAPPHNMPASAADAKINESLNLVNENNVVRLELPNGPTICIQAQGAKDPAMFHYIQLYTAPDQPFFCIEPWTGHPNALNSVWGTRRLAPGTEEKALLRIWLEPDDS